MYRVFVSRILLKLRLFLNTLVLKDKIIIMQFFCGNFYGYIVSSYRGKAAKCYDTVLWPQAYPENEMNRIGPTCRFKGDLSRLKLIGASVRPQF